MVYNYTIIQRYNIAKGEQNVNPLNFSLDFRSNIPVYAQIVEQVQGWLANGDLKPGDQLPTVRQLASELRVNFNTIARAYRLLDEAGLISTQRGRGTYFLEQVSDKNATILKQESLRFQTQRFLQSLLRQGYSTAEIEETIESALTSAQLDIWNDKP
jgi:GntR family transcriptional regulator